MSAHQHTVSTPPPRSALNAATFQRRVMEDIKPLHIQASLRAGKTLPELAARYELNIRRHSLIPSLVHFAYSYDSPLHEPLVQQCRGLILDEADNWKIVARPFDKFFNLGDPKAAHVDWKFAHIYEKLDGSLIYLYNYKRMWYVGTTGSPEASGEVNGWNTTFAELFWMVFQDKGYRLPDKQDRDWTFMFELMTPYNKVVVQHKEDKLVLIGARHTESGCDVPLHILDSMGFDMAERLPWKPVDQLLNFEGINPLEMEGYVIGDAAGNRVKLKHPGYVALHQLKGSFSPRAILEVIRGGDYNEVLVSFPEWRDELVAVKWAYDAMVRRIEDSWTSTRYAQSKKDFALKVKHLPFAGILFGLWDGYYATVRDGLRTLHIDSLKSLLERSGA